MRAAWACVVLAIAVAARALAGDEAPPIELHVRAGDLQSLQAGLLALAEDRLRSAGLFVDRQRVWLTLSDALPITDTIEVRPAWLTNAQQLESPLIFNLLPKSPAMARRVRGAHPLQATLVFPLQRDVRVAARRLRKGSAVMCADLDVQRRDVRRVPALAMSMSCEIAAGAVVLRDIGAGDVLRSVDIGMAPDVTAGAAVRVSVAVGGINVSTTATALADAKVGDQIDVRLPHPTRTLKTRVTGPGTVQLMGGAL